MSEYLKTFAKSAQPFDAPYGNKTTKRYTMETNSSGVVINSDASAALGSGDTVVLGVLGAGTELHDCLGIVSNAFKTSTTCALGFRYVDGVDSSAVPQDADYFFAALALDAAGRTRANNTAVAPVKLPKDAYLVLTHSAHTQDVVGVVDFLVDMVCNGPA